MSKSILHKLRAGEVPHPTARKWSAEKWGRLLSEGQHLGLEERSSDSVGQPVAGALSEEDQSMYMLGIEVAETLSEIRARAMEVHSRSMGDIRVQRLLVAANNRDYAVLSKGFDDSEKGRSTPVLLDTYRSEKLPIGPRRELISTEGMLDGMTESLRFPLSHVIDKRGLTNKGAKKRNPKELLRDVVELRVMGGYYGSVDSMWAACAWGNHMPAFHDGFIAFVPRDKVESIQQAVRTHRHDMLLMEAAQHIALNAHGHANFRELIEQVDVRVVINDDGCFQRIERGGGESIPSLSLLMQLVGAEVYWDELLSASIERLSGLCVRDLLCGWMSVSALAEAQIKLWGQDTDVPSLSHLRRYAPMVTKAQLKTLLEGVRGSDSTASLDDVIDALTYPGHLKDTWLYPIVKCGPGRYVINQAVACTGSIVRSIEHWLREDGELMRRRGRAFENYIKAEMRAAAPCAAVKGKFSVYDGPARVRSEGEEEEIDLIFKVGNCVFVGESKCVAFPTEPSEYRSMRNRLEEGAGQAARKAVFLRRHHESFLSAAGWWSAGDKMCEFAAIVICNQPIASGYSVAGVPVVDEHMLLRGVDRGEVRLLCDLRSGEAQHVSSIFQKHKDVGEALLDFYKDPPHVRLLESYVNLREAPVPWMKRRGVFLSAIVDLSSPAPRE